MAALLGWYLVSTGTAGPAEPTPTPPRVQATTPVTMPAAALSERATLACRALLSQLPAGIRDLARRPVTAGPEQNAAYGDPAVTVACGLPEPAVEPTADLLLMDGVCWYPVDGPDATVFTTLDRETPVQVTVPASYEQRGQWANEFSTQIALSIRGDRANLPSGCTG